MKFKGFTLAEILIVLTIIGVMAVMTIPSLIQNSNSQQKIAQFKKAFNTMNNAYAAEFALKSPPKTRANRQVLLDAWAKQLNVKYYYVMDNVNNSLTKYYSTEGFKGKIEHYWSVTEDGFAYYINVGNSTLCNSNDKLTVNSKYSHSATVDSVCLFVTVDVNGYKSPNLTCADNVDLNKLNNCDRISFYVSKDGITAGNPDCTIAGRIMSDNIEYDNNRCKSQG